jgi:hypothetical protein
MHFRNHADLPHFCHGPRDPRFFSVLIRAPVNLNGPDSLGRPPVYHSLRRVDSLAQLAAVPAKALKLEILNSRPHNNLVDLNIAGLFDGICYRSGNGVGRDCDLIEVLHIL